LRRLISWLIMVPAAVAVVIFALNNKDIVALNLWPFAMVIEIELYMVLTVVLGTGVLLGGVASWAGAGRLRAELRKQSYNGEVARRQLKTEQEKAATLEAEVKVLKMHQLDGNASDGLNKGAKLPGDDAKTIAHASAASAGQLPKPQNAA